jgi:hypothetical protein
MAKFNLDNYETVEDRLKVFWNDNPEGRIETEILHITPDGQCVTIQASVFKQEEDARPVATGIAQETKGQGGFANADAWMENCETSAIGRALANWKYQGAKAPRPSKQEMSKVGNKPVADVKVDKPKMTTDKEDIKVLEKAKQDFAESIQDKPSTVKADQMNMLIDGFELDKSVAQHYKREAFKKSGLSKDVESWTNDDMSAFLDLFEQEVESNKTDTDLIEDVFGEVKDLTQNCPQCGKSDYIEDNREKKASDPRFSKIPSWSCSNYKDNDGCGWTAWGDTDCPPEWL